MSKKYHLVRSDEWLRLLPRYQEQCCDCGLVHRIDVKIIKGQVWMRMARDERATAQVRRWKKVKR